MGWKEFVTNALGDVLDFLASIAGSVLSWPVAFMVAVAVFYKPIRGLIGRVKSGKVAGVEFEIREELQDAGDAALDAIREASEKKLGRIDLPATEPGRRPTSAGQQTTTTPDLATPQRPRGGSDLPESEGVSDRSHYNSAVAWNTYLMLMEAREQTPSDGSIFDAPPSVRQSGEAVGTILWYFNNLEQGIRDLYGQVTGEAPSPRMTASRMVVNLARREILNDSFVESFDALRRIRNEVAHGKARPTLADARDFGRTATQLEAIVKADMEQRDRESTGDASE